MRWLVRKVLAQCITVTQRGERVTPLKPQAKTLGIFILILSLLAISICATQAQATPKWIILNADVISEVNAGSLNAQVQVTEVEAAAELTDPITKIKTKVKRVILLTEILRIKTEVWCSGVELKNLSLIGEGRLSEEGKVKFTECETKLNGQVATECAPKSAGAPTGTIETNLVNVELRVHTLSDGIKDEYIRITPPTGSSFVTIEMGVACPIGNKVPVVGVLSLRDLALGTHLVEHLIEPGSQAETIGKFYVISDTAEHAASVRGSVKIALTGKHEGLKWAGFPQAKISESKWIILKSAGTKEFDASSLSAQVGVNELDANAELTNPVTKEKTKVKKVVLTTKIGLAKTEFWCSEVSLINLNLLGAGKFEGRAKFAGCEVKLEGETSPECAPKSGVIETNVFSGVITGTGTVEIKPTGAAFSVLELGASCYIGIFKLSFEGTLVLKDLSLGTHSVSHLFSVAGGALSVNGKSATASGSAKFGLIGPHIGLKWAGFGE
jgi:hypothetical protein